jgi:Fungal chitosanase of glycosyl hydrolase group 75
MPNAPVNAGSTAPKSTPTLTTPDGYTPPPKSRELLAGVPFNLAERVGEKYTARFARWDKTKKGQDDPSLCRGLYRLPGAVLFWESKMAVDADGATTPSVLKSSSGSQEQTSYFFGDKKKTPVNAEIVPYFVVPTFDDPKLKKPGKPFEGSRDRFVKDFGLEHGNLGVVIFGSKITGAIFADEGPAMKIGEASIRVHELIRKPGAPWKGDPAKKILLDASEEKGVLYFVFPDTTFDIDTFGPTRQGEMAAAIHTAAMERFGKLKAS